MGAFESHLLLCAVAQFTVYSEQTHAHLLALASCAVLLFPAQLANTRQLSWHVVAQIGVIASVRCCGVARLLHAHWARLLC